MIKHTKVSIFLVSQNLYNHIHTHSIKKKKKKKKKKTAQTTTHLSKTIDSHHTL